MIAHNSHPYIFQGGGRYLNSLGMIIIGLAADFKRFLGLRFDLLLFYKLQGSKKQ